MQETLHFVDCKKERRCDLSSFCTLRVEATREKTVVQPVNDIDSQTKKLGYQVGIRITNLA